MDQLVDAINGVAHSTPVELPAAVGDASGGTTRRVFAACGAGTLLFVRSGGGFRQMEARISTATTTQADTTIARSLDGDTLSVRWAVRVWQWSSPTRPVIHP